MARPRKNHYSFNLKATCERCLHASSRSQDASLVIANTLGGKKTDDDYSQALVKWTGLGDAASCGSKNYKKTEGIGAQNDRGLGTGGEEMKDVSGPHRSPEYPCENRMNLCLYPDGTKPHLMCDQLHETPPTPAAATLRSLRIGRPIVPRYW